MLRDRPLILEARIFPTLQTHAKTLLQLRKSRRLVLKHQNGTIAP